jgi:hypothetical protein
MDETTKHRPSSQAIIRFWPLLWNVSFLLTLLVNGLVLASGVTNALSGWIYFFGLLQTLLAGFLVAGDVLKRREYINARGWIARLHERRSYLLFPWEYIRATLIGPQYGHRQAVYNAISTYHILRDSRIQYYIAYFSTPRYNPLLIPSVFAFLGLAHSPLWFSFHLFQLFLRSQHLQFIARALRRNIVPLLLTIWMQLNVNYAFGVVALSFFSQFFNGDVQAQHCHSAMQCLISLVFYGVPNNGAVNGFVSPPVVRPLSLPPPILSHLLSLTPLTARLIPPPTLGQCGTSLIGSP